MTYLNTEKQKTKKKSFIGSATGLVVSKLDLQWKGCGFKSHQFSSKVLDGKEVKAIPGSIPAPILVHYKKIEKYM